MKRSMIGRSGALTVAAALTLGGLAMLPLGAQAMGRDTVQSFYSTLLSTMQSGRSLGGRGRYARLEPVVRQVFDIPFMTRLAVGPEWASLNETQRQQVTQAFESYVAAIYAERFDSYSGESLQVTGEQASPGGTIITSQIVKSNGEPVNINYLVRQNGGTWQIADVYLDGTISELATRRSEFASILRTQGINGLIAMLNNKAAVLAARL
jgi:phospholipid transport system substrate-binding protein